MSLATFLEHRTEDVDPYALLLTGGGLGPRLLEGGVPVWQASDQAGRPSPSRALRFTRSLAPLLRGLEPDVVWATGQKAALLAAPACRCARVPLVWHKIDFSWDSVLAKPLAACVNGVIGVSDAVLDPLGPYRSERVLGVVGPPLRLPRKTTAPDRPACPTIGTLARLVPYKGHHHILRAAGALSREFPNLRVVLAGEAEARYPDYPASLEALARELGLSDQVELPGFVPDAPRVLERLSVFVNATYRDAEGFGFEGLSGAMLEASWTGLPVVATRGGGTAEGMLPGETGTLVERAEPALLAEAIRPLLRDPDLAARMGAAGMAFARERFAPEVAAARVFELLGEAAARGDRRHTGRKPPWQRTGRKRSGRGVR